MKSELKDEIGAIIKARFSHFDLEKSDLELLSQSAIYSEFEAKQNLYQSKKSCYGFVIIIDGVLRAYTLSPNAKEITIFTLKRGDECIICSTCTADSLQMEINLEVRECLKICSIPPEVFSKMREKYPKLANYTLELLSKRFAQSINIMQQALFLPLTERIEEFLRDNAKNNIVAFTHEEIANNLGSSREAISRILKEMEKAGKITISRSKITIKD
ncbi:hypothetical protein CCY99_01095 [Helicobacter sp. 16-1353]|uniref:Crp/Fnr family transcriptional regulator n=1 Tax=Helicobacter sp. 16-1353 TaxID=2004996 RepID=UPI000DCC2C3F|nr:Crp/Fnr family transcriptional regulator [Helicobacter sp. 16-1353]RAX55324.1 hypothetical protein CCY99_01095 [Helicobacter sp. 16-1353]